MLGRLERTLDFFIELLKIKNVRNSAPFTGENTGRFETALLVEVMRACSRKKRLISSRPAYWLWWKIVKWVNKRGFWMNKRWKHRPIFDGGGINVYVWKKMDWTMKWNSQLYNGNKLPSSFLIWREKQRKLLDILVLLRSNLSPKYEGWCDDAGKLPALPTKG